MLSHFTKVQHVIKGNHTREYAAATANGDDDIPKLAVNQYIPVDNPNPGPGDVTIIAAHANGFPKELYEPLWDELYARTSQNGVRIRSIWIADMWNQGQSGVLNEEIMGNDPSWFDHARDLMSLINQKQDAMPHPIIGIGHSMGGTQLSILALLHPRLLRSLVLIDPVIQVSSGGVVPAGLSTSRRDIWPSREDAAAGFQRSKFYQAWDPRVLDLWVKHGLRQLPTELYPSESSSSDQRVTLTTPKHQELFTFLRPTYRDVPGDKLTDKDPVLDKEHPEYPFYRSEALHVFRRLPELRPSVLYIFGRDSPFSTPELRNEKVSRTGVGVSGSGGVPAGRVDQAVLDCGHLVAMERVAECADATAAFIENEQRRWQQECDEFREYQAQKTRREQSTIDSKWAENVKPKIQGRVEKL